MDGQFFMIEWKLLSHPEELRAWDSNLMQFADYNYCQTLAWGDYRAYFGWKLYRWAAYTENGEPVALMQGLLRIYPGRIGVLWVPGGPIGDISLMNKDSQRLIVQTTGIKRLYCRISSTRAYRAGDSLMLKHQGWNRAIRPLGSGMSMLYDVIKDGQSRLENCSTNWRHNLNRSGKYNLTIQQLNNPDLDTITVIYRDMEAYKDIGQQYSRQELERMFDVFRDKLVFYGCTDEAGELIAFRGCALLGVKAWDLLAATTVKGRNLYASYPLFWKLIEHCVNAGITSYDMGGIDPYGNKGVYHFKKGTGAKEIEYLGEWEWSSSEIIRYAANWAIRRRAGKL
jgi:lipid II:glycine glycyltransferase (peptidoglycan interpeptide bridge formation enzyme)